MKGNGKKQKFRISGVTNEEVRDAILSEKVQDEMSAAFQHIQNVFSFFNSEMEFNATTSCVAVGQVMNQVALNLVKDTSPEILRYIFAEAENEKELASETKRICHGLQNVGTIFNRIVNAHLVMEQTKNVTQKDGTFQMAEALWRSGVLGYLKSYKMSVSEYQTCTETWLREEELPKSAKPFKRLIMQLGKLGIVDNLVEYFGIKDDENLRDNILRLMVEIKSCGLTDEQRSIIAGNNYSFKKLSETFTENESDYTKEQKKNIADSAQRLSSMESHLHIDIKGNYGEANLAMFLRLFSNKWYNVFKEYLMVKSEDDNHERLDVEQFLELDPEDRINFLVKCSPDEYNNLCSEDRLAIIPRLTDNDFKKLDFYTQFERMAFWSHGTNKRLTKIKTDKDKADSEARKNKLLAGTGGKGRGKGRGKGKTKTTTAPAEPVILKPVKRRV